MSTRALVAVALATATFRLTDPPGTTLVVTADAPAVKVGSADEIPAGNAREEASAGSEFHGTETTPTTTKHAMTNQASFIPFLPRRVGARRGRERAVVICPPLGRLIDKRSRR